MFVEQRYTDYGLEISVLRTHPMTASVIKTILEDIHFSEQNFIEEFVDTLSDDYDLYIKLIGEFGFIKACYLVLQNGEEILEQTDTHVMEALAKFFLLKINPSQEGSG